MASKVKIIIKPIISLAVIILIFFVSTSFSKEVRETAFVQEIVLEYRYIGVLTTSFISGLNLIVPIPAIAFLPLFFAAGLDLSMTILIITIGVTLADSFAYLVGSVGRKLVSSPRQVKITNQFQRIRNRYSFLPLVILFLSAAFVPLPNEIIIIPLAFLGYHLYQIFPVLLIGNATFNILSAIGILNFIEYFNLF